MNDKVEEWVKEAGLQNSKKIIMDDIVPDEEKTEFYYWGWVDDHISLSHTLEEAQKRVAEMKTPIPKGCTKKSIKQFVQEQYNKELEKYNYEKIKRGLTNETCWWYKT